MQTSFHNLVFFSETVRKMWDSKKSAIQNLEAMGLVADPNKDIIGSSKVKY